MEVKICVLDVTCMIIVQERRWVNIRILLLDIETSPNSAFVWGLWNQNISIDKIIDSSEVLCWAAKWLGEKHVLQFDKRAPGMLNAMHNLLEEADAVVTYNGNSFDLPVLNKEFLSNDFNPPAPYKSIDLCKVVQKKFRFPSSKLDYVCKALGLDTKVKHEGFELWVKCMNDDAKAWKRMREYNRQDVVILEQLYNKLLPWIPSHPSHATFDDTKCCTNCGSTNYQRRGVARTMQFTYPRYSCNACGAWFRGTKREPSKNTKGRVAAC